MFIRPTLCLTALTLTAAAHHGRDYLLVQDAAVPAPFTGILFNNFELSAQTGPDEWSVEPGIQYGLGRGFSAGIAASFMDEGEGWEYASVSPQMQWEILPAANRRIRLSLLAGYQFGNGAGDEEAHEHDVAEAEICGPEYGPDSLPCEAAEVESHAGAHEHHGIHQHGADAFFARIIMEADITAATKLAVNLISVVPDGDEAQWGYAAGLRHAFSHEFALGVEALGDLRRHGYHEAALAAYVSPTHTLSFKFGLGAGLTAESPDFTVHTGVLVRF